MRNGVQSLLMLMAEEHLRRYPNDKDVLAIMAKLAYRRKEYHLCREYLNRYLSIHPQFEGNLALYADAREQ